MAPIMMGMLGNQELRKVCIRITGFIRLSLAALGFLTATIEVHAASTSKAALPPEIMSFIMQKEAEARARAQKLDLKVSDDVWAFFRTAQTGSATAITNSFERLKKRSGPHEESKDDPTVGTPVFQTVIEVTMAAEAFTGGDPRFCLAFGKGVIGSIPPGSIYFGGTGAGRGLVTALCKSQWKGDPFFTIAQNGLTNERYLEYIRAIYGDKIRTLTTNDSQKASQEYLADAQKRLEHDRRFPDERRQIKPGEDVRMVENRVQASGHMAVIGVRELLTRIFFDNNPDREFYIEESFPLEWMYPQLSPYGLIFKLNRQPLPALSADVLKEDREFWLRQQTEMIGDWLTPNTPVKEVADFAQKTFGRKDLSGFKGDRRFVENAYATKLYSKLRSSIGGLYHWRATHSKSAQEQKLMIAEADFAFRQAFAMCPSNPEAVFRYVSLLMAAGRIEDALGVAGAAQSVDPGNSQLESLISELNRMQRTSPRKTNDRD